jgi:hypothetical protein
MKAKIDGSGGLWLERKGKLRKQGCPISNDPHGYCGEWCPHFNITKDKVRNPQTGEREFR